MMSFPAYGSTSAAGSQEQRRSGPIFETRWSAALSRTNQPAHPEKGVHVGGTQTQPDRHNKTPRKHRTREVARFWYGLLDLNFLGDYLCLSAADLLSPSRHFVSPFGNRRVCHLQLPARVMPTGFQQLGGEVLIFP